MDRLKRARRPLRAQLTRNINESIAIIESEDPDLITLQSKLSVMQAVAASIMDCDNRIREKMVEDEDDEAEEDNEYQDMDRYTMSYLNIKAKIEALLKPPTVNLNNSSVTDKKKYKLPTIELPIFDGELKSWMSWWARFAKYHDDQDMSATDKFEYLIQAVKPETKAHKIVTSYPVTERNYVEAIADLREHFGQTDLQLQVYVRELLNLVVYNVTSSKKLTLSELSTNVESHLRCLEQLQLKNADPDIWLYPLVESSLPEDALRVWQQHPLSSTDGTKLNPPKSRLDFLREFMRKEVKNEQMISLARDGFGISAPEPVPDKDKKVNRFRKGKQSEEDVATAAGLFSTMSVKSSCLFCEKPHDSAHCLKAQTMTHEEREKVCQEKRACFRCLKVGHPIKNCQTPVRCLVCGGKHYPIMCKKVSRFDDQGEGKRPSNEDVDVGETVQTTVSHEATPNILLNTLKVNLIGNDGSSTSIRIIGDTGSQRSYVTSSAVKKGMLTRVGEEMLQNIVFGGQLTPPGTHGKYRVPLKPLKTDKSTRYNFKLLEKETICGKIASVPNGPWLNELKEKGITLSDVGNRSSKVDILLGNDYWPHIVTGKIIKLKCGLVATETIFGWTMGGRLPRNSTSMACTTISLLSTPTDVNQLWDLETIGIREPIEQKSSKEAEQEAVKYFVDNVKRDDEGRYVVALPWNGNEANLPNNYLVARKRLDSATAKLDKESKWQQYDSVFRSWEKEGLISTTEGTDKAHFLPHRPVFKESLTTPVRPVFDASCHTRGNPALNHCLVKGPNLIELIPTMILRFQENTVGISADIRKAFQMIRVREKDQPYQRFLWYKDIACKEVKIYQHDRVVFGINCSPFLLGATIDYHLRQHKDPYAIKMTNQFYVDNLATSVASMDEYVTLRETATRIMADAKMELREWASTLSQGMDESDGSNKEMSILGLVWNRREDTLRCSVGEISLDEGITKKKMLSALAKQFDPMGYLSPTTLQVKMLLQKTWVQDLGWDDNVDEATEQEFRAWTSALPTLGDIHIPRHFRIGNDSRMQLHVFSDASQEAYAAAVYLRSELDGRVKVQLLLAKTRLAPLGKKKSRMEEKPKIPRLELMGCVIGARLANTVREALGYRDIPIYFWTDSSVSLAWIQRDGDWGVFVSNRVKEIRTTTQRDQWRHISGRDNPADLPSRGCSPQRLLESRWWEGPTWLYQPENEWPSSIPQYIDSEIDMERKKISINVATVASSLEVPKFESYRKNVAVIGWMLRLKYRRNKMSSVLSISELRRAERVLIRLIQQQAFGDSKETVGKLQVVLDEDGIFRVNTRLSLREDLPGFIAPILLPNNHPMVSALIKEFHLVHGHGGVNFVREKLREKYWIINSRRSVARVLGDCKKCLRHVTQPFNVDPAPLPKQRISDCDPFTTVGVDLAGPLFLKSNKKAWIVIYTCAVYRCVHLDLVTSLSSEALLGSLERFISDCGRPNNIFSDNGTNFVGAANIFRDQDWKEIEEKTHAKQIQWIFNVPTAAWWGGWWERLIRSVKDLLKRILGKSKLDYDQMRTCLAGVASTINDRPLTVVTESNGDLHPLCPSMFIRPLRVGVFPDVEKAAGLPERYRVMKDIQRQLQERFRKEYLAMLVMPRTNKKKQQPTVGDVVLVGADNKRRFEWPLGVIEELCTGRDGKVRMAKVKTSNGFLSRPLQRLYPLEMTNSCEVGKIVLPKEPLPEEKNEEPKVIKTRLGRVVKKPTRYAQWIHLTKE